ncbi:MAG: septation regulator SpoVG [Clostridiales bacterium]|jgi:stage V sporulation protein G|nr:septation regulator SpoVG [Clostridiales bacterium]
MEVTDVRIRKLHQAGENGSKMRAIVSVTFDNEFVVHDIKVIQGETKHFIAMPSRKVEDGTYKDITHPIQSSLRFKIQDAVLSRYEQALQEAGKENIGSEEISGGEEQ